VTDKELIKMTGGILQGMSGSPIIQDGKFAGAITHMVIDNPVKGAAIAIQEMMKKHP
jgi:stage IV sporulation protein B